MVKILLEGFEVALGEFGGIAVGGRIVVGLGLQNPQIELGAGGTGGGCMLLEGTLGFRRQGEAIRACSHFGLRGG